MSSPFGITTDSCSSRLPPLFRIFVICRPAVTGPLRAVPACCLPCGGPAAIARLVRVARISRALAVKLGHRRPPLLIASGAQRRDLGFEVVKRLEPPVHAREPQIGDFVERAKRTEYRQADLMRGDLAKAARPDRVFDPLRQDRELVFGDRPALAGAADAVHDLVPVEGLRGTASLADHQDDGLLGGKPPTAFLARPAPADCDPVIGRPAVNDPAVRVPTVRAVHTITPCRPF